MRKIYTSYGCHELSQYVTRCITESHNVHKFTLDATCVQKGVQLVTKVCYYLEFSYIYKHLIIKKKPLLNCRRLYTWCTYNKLNNNNLRCFIIHIFSPCGGYRRLPTDRQGSGQVPLDIFSLGGYVYLT